MAAPGVLDNDTDVEGDSLTITSYTQPSNGFLVQSADGSFTHTPDENFCGIDSYDYTISDGNGGSDTATVTASRHGWMESTPACREVFCGL